MPPEELTPDRYRQAQDLAAEAWTCPPKLRRVFLAGACGSDVELLREALALLEARGTLEPDIDKLDIGSQVGDYRIRRELGRGGMGIVYAVSRADRDTGSRLALKLVRPDAVEDGIAKRFALERRVLASLEHPNIARLIDAGELDDGRSYLVMEHVEGLPITEYADRSRCSLRERLELFQIVCAAVAHAHERKVIHRDIKPSNVLVTASGMVKLLDFGIAKLAGSGHADLTQLTATNLAPGTPLYASPEQMRGHPVDFKADVYALGVVLFELLTGWWPFVSREGPGGAAVVRPSDAVSARPEHLSVVSDSGDFSPAVVARARRTTPARLLRHLRGDLDAIVLKALREDPGDRYETAEALSEDVQRYLDGRPVVSRPSSWRYRAARFGRRHRRGVVATGLLATVLLVAAGATLLNSNIWAPRRQSETAGTSQAPSAPVAIPAPTQSESNQATSSAPNPTSSSPPESGNRDGEAGLLTRPDEGGGDEQEPAATRPLPGLGDAVMPIVEPPTSLGLAQDIPLGPPPVGNAPPPDLELEYRKIAETLQRYADAYRTGNAALLKEVFPAAPVASLALDRRFARGRYEVAIGDVKPQVRGDRAHVTCHMTLIYVPDVGSERRQEGGASFFLQLNGDTWIITEAVHPDRLGEH